MNHKVGSQIQLSIVIKLNMRATKWTLLLLLIKKKFNLLQKQKKSYKESNEEIYRMKKNCLTIFLARHKLDGTLE